MTKSLIALVVCLIILTASASTLNTYNVEFSQIGDKLVVKEVVNNIEKEAYVTSEGIEESEKGYYFVKKIIFNESYDKFKAKLNLDVGVVLQDFEVYPPGYKIESDGQIISLIWEMNNVKVGDSFAMFVMLKDTTKNSNLILVIGILVLIMAIVFLYLYYRRMVKRREKTARKTIGKKKIAKKELKNKYNYLLDSEKKIIEELKKADRNELWQKQIQNLTEFSKAKVSRIIRNLEVRGLVQKIPFGNTNKIRLK